MEIVTKAQLAMFMPFPSPSYIAEVESTFDLSRKRRRSGCRGSWLLAESIATVTVSGDPSTISVSIGEDVYEEHYVNLLSYARLHPSVIVASYALSGIKQKFALRFFSDADGEECFQALQEAFRKPGSQQPAVEPRMECLMKVLFQDEGRSQHEKSCDTDAVISSQEGTDNVTALPVEAQAQNNSQPAATLENSISLQDELPAQPISSQQKLLGDAALLMAMAEDGTPAETAREELEITPQKSLVDAGSVPSLTPGAWSSLTTARTFPALNQENATEAFPAATKLSGLAEEILGCLLDPTFPAFVKEVGKIWSDLERNTAALKFIV